MSTPTNKLPEPLKASGHLANQPGLRGHSHDPASDLLKPYLLEKQIRTPKRKYWLAIASFDTVPTGKELEPYTELEHSYRVRNQNTWKV